MNAKKIIVCTAAALIFGCSGEEKSHVEEELPSEPVEVTVEIVKPEKTPTLLEAVGTVRSAVTTNLSSRIMGYVTEILVEEGQQVKRDQLLARIDSRETEAQVEKAEAGLAEAESAQDEVDRAIGAARSALEATQANARLAESTYKRFQELLSRKSVSQQEFDEVETKYTAAQAEVRRAEEMLQSLQAKKEQVAARINQAKANLANARLFEDYVRITSPLNGVVTSKNVEVGQLASPGTALFTIEDGRNYRLEATVEESRMKYISISQNVDVRIDALDENLVGKIAEIVPVADPTSRSFTVKIDLPSHPQLRSGLFGRVQFPAEPRELVTVPEESIVSRGQLSAVYVVDMDEKARFHLVKTGKAFGNRVEIISGLEEGDRVVIQPIDQVQDGQPVLILQSAANRWPGIENSMMTVAGGHV